MPDRQTYSGDSKRPVSTLALTAIVVDQDGVVIAADRETSESAPAGSGDWIPAGRGNSYIAACEAVDEPDAALGHSLADGVRDILAERTSSFEMAYTRALPDGEHHFLTRVTRIPSRGGLQAVVTHTDVTARRASSTALRVSQTQLQNILDGMSCGVIAFHNDRQIAYLNRLAEDLFGYRSPEVIGRPLAMLMPGIARAIPEADDGSLSCPPDEPILISGFHKSGEEFPLEITLSRTAAENGPVYTAMLRDVSGQRRIEAAEREQRALAEALSSAAVTLNSTLNIQQVLDHILACVGLVVPHDGANIMLVEEQVARVVCLAGEYVRAGRTASIVGSELPFERFPHFRDVVATRQSAIIEDSQTDPRWTDLAGTEWVRSSISVPIGVGEQVFGFLNLDSKLPGTFGAQDARHLEVFAAHAAIAIRNAQLFEDEHFQRLLAESLQRTAEAMTKSTATRDVLPIMLDQLRELIGCSWAAVFLLNDNELELIASTGGQVPDREAEAHDDRPPAFQYQALPLFYDPLSSGQTVIVRDVRLRAEAALLGTLGAPLGSWIGLAIVAWDIVIGYLAVANDTPTPYSKRAIGAVQSFAYQAALILQNSEVFSELEMSRSDLNEAQTRLARAVQLQVAGEIATGIAHQVNNPLTTVIAESYLLAKYLPPDNPHYDSVQAIREAAYRAGTVIQRLVDFARARPFEMETVDVNLSVSNAAALLRDQIEPHIARLTLELAPDLPTIQGSERHLEDVWLNLLLNARDAIDPPGSGEIQLTTAYDKRNDVIVVRITDNGQGIAPDRLDKIFKPFYTTKEKGSGLGLSICKDVVAKHGGAIRIESIQHQGATALVTLPAGPHRR